jgi:hypothetical protein
MGEVRNAYKILIKKSGSSHSGEEVWMEDTGITGAREHHNEELHNLYMLG